MIEYNAFEKWVLEKDLLYRNLQVYKKLLCEYIQNEIESNGIVIKENIYQNFNTVLGKCDNITYDEPGVPQAYIILHFLDRYHRFQITYMHMLQNGCFPIKKEVSYMDIGTGPGMSMFAYSDMISMIQQYEIENYGKTTIENVYIDYVEQSEGFRNFLHVITEMLLQNSHRSYVPFHHGTYYNADEMKFSGEKQECSYIIDGGKLVYYEAKEVKVRKSFDIVVYSNFLTTINILNHFHEHIKRAMINMKNQGILLVVGGSQSSPKYAPIYSRLKEYVIGWKYGNWKYKAWCKILWNAEEMSYDGADRFSKEIKQFYCDMLNALTDNNWEKLDANFLNLIKKNIKTNNKEKWFVTLYRKHSIYKHKSLR